MPREGSSRVGSHLHRNHWSEETGQVTSIEDVSREVGVSVGPKDYVVLFEVVGDEVVVGAVRHQREDDCRH